MKVGSVCQQIESFLQQAIETQDASVPEALRPRHCRPRVALRDGKNGRKVRIDKELRPQDQTAMELVIHFEIKADVRGSAQTRARRSENGVGAAPANSPNAPRDDWRRDLVHAVLGVEREGRPFISLVWFRDNWLPFAWAADPQARQQAIATAIQEGLLTVQKVPNPKNPTYPVSAIALNRAHALVRSVLANSENAPMFEPVRILGEPLSATILKDRR